MKTVPNLIKGTIWTAGAFGANQVIRIVSSIILARLLAPDIFGVMLIVYSVRNGFELISDIGVSQNIVADRNGEKPEFFNTAWSLRLIRGGVLWAACIAFAFPLAHFYGNRVIALILPIAGSYFVIASSASLGTSFLQKRMEVLRLSIFDFVVETTATVGQLVFAFLNPTVWALVFGSLLSPAVRAIGSYLIVPDIRHKFFISRIHSKRIVSFGKWIFLSSLIFFLSANFDRLYLGKAVPLTVLGVYGIAKNLSDVLNSFVNRLNYVVIFPFIAKNVELPRLQLRLQVRPVRRSFLAITAMSFACLVAASDFLISLLYDQRYHSAGWMLSILCVGAWFSVLCTVNESTLLGFGKPFYGAVANCLKFLWLVAGLPFALNSYGFAGVVIVVALADVWRYFPLLVGQRRESFCFLGQDLVASCVFLALTGLLEWLRFAAGTGTSLFGFRTG